MSVVPVIDITDLYCEDVDRRRAVARRIGTACTEVGFFQVVGHGLPEELVEAVYDTARAFFALPLEEKRRVGQPDPETVRGYVAVGEENFNYYENRDAPPDLHEKFDIGPVDVPDEPYYRTEAARTAFAPNLWPERPPGMREAWTAYFVAANELCRLVFRTFALALDLPEDFFDDTMDRDISMLRAIHYPHQEEPPLPGQMRGGAHTDLGSLTIVRPEEAPGGLQVFTQDGDWVDVPVIPGALVVNIGDLMARWTNDRWISTRHRVVNPPRDADGSTDRMSIVFFHQPNYDAVIEALATCAQPGEAPRYASTTSGAHLAQRYAQGYEATLAR